MYPSQQEYYFHHTEVTRALVIRYDQSVPFVATGKEQAYPHTGWYTAKNRFVKKIYNQHSAKHI